MTTATIANHTPAELKAFNRRTLRPLVAALLAARVFAECERERVDAYTAPILAEYDFRDQFTGERITNSEFLYCVEELDTPQMQEFNARVLAANIAHGWTGNPEHCPACVARSAVSRAENAVCEAVCRFMGVDSDYCYGKIRADILSLAVDMFAKELR